VKRHPSLSPPDDSCCVRCKRKEEGFCVQRFFEEEKEGGVEYRADGIGEGELDRKIKGLLEVKKKRERRESVGPYLLLTRSIESLFGGVGIRRKVRMKKGRVMLVRASPKSLELWRSDWLEEPP
jgi:hypothetical protein